MIRTQILSCLFWLAILTPCANAGVFNTTQFLNPNQFMIGFGPDLTFSDYSGAGVGFDAKYTVGVSDLLNAAFLAGTGVGPGNFELGFREIFDFFPDTEAQPGLGLGTQLLYQRLGSVGRLDVTATPYFHNSYKTQQGEVFSPFLAVPLGWGFKDSETEGLMSVVLGSLFRPSPKWLYSLELGINITGLYTYIGAGVAFVYE